MSSREDASVEFARIVDKWLDEQVLSFESAFGEMLYIDSDRVPDVLLNTKFVLSVLETFNNTLIGASFIEDDLARATAFSSITTMYNYMMKGAILRSQGIRMVDFIKG